MTTPLHAHIPLHPVTPAQRNPRPICAGQAHNQPLATALATGNGLNLGQPVTGTAWNLGGMTVVLSIVEPAGVGDFAKVVLGLHLDGRELDIFTFLWNNDTSPKSPNAPLVESNQYQPGFTVYDTSDLSLVEHYADQQGSPYAYFNVNLEWRANVSYT